MRTTDAERRELRVLAEDGGGARLVDVEERADVGVVPRELELVRGDAAELVSVAVVDDVDRAARARGRDEVAIETIDDREPRMQRLVLARDADDERLALGEPALAIGGDL